MTNRYCVDVAYFKKELASLSRSLEDRTPEELYRYLLKLAEVARPITKVSDLIEPPYKTKLSKTKKEKFKKLAFVFAQLQTDTYYPDDSNDVCQKNLINELKSLVSKETYSKLKPVLESLAYPSNITMFKKIQQTEPLLFPLITAFKGDINGN
jgi:hypothetical protein